MKGIKMQRVTKKRLNAFIEKVADIKPSTIKCDGGKCYYSKLDGSYFTRVGMENLFKVLLKKGITEELQGCGPDCKVVSIGFNPEENKWYGWSHRAMYGFTIGSTCKKGDCHYQPMDEVDFMDDCRLFWHDSKIHHYTEVLKSTNEEGVLGAQITWQYNNKIKNKKLHGQISSIFTQYPNAWGKGDWVAKTMEDAKQMAIDFSRGVS